MPTRRMRPPRFPRSLSPTRRFAPRYRDGDLPLVLPQVRASRIAGDAPAAPSNAARTSHEAVPDKCASRAHAPTVVSATPGRDILATEETARGAAGRIGQEATAPLQLPLETADAVGCPEPGGAIIAGSRGAEIEARAVAVRTGGDIEQV